MKVFLVTKDQGHEAVVIAESEDDASVLMNETSGDFDPCYVSEIGIAHEDQQRGVIVYTEPL